MITTRGIFLPGLVACLAGALVLAAPQPASALPAAGSLPAATKLAVDESNAGLVQEVGKRYYKKRYRYGYRPYRYRNYGYYRPYYRPYSYYRPYAYQPYYGGGWGYPYYRRSGVSLWFGF